MYSLYKHRGLLKDFLLQLEKGPKIGQGIFLNAKSDEDELTA
jgi:hypothetical protein